MLDFTPDPVAIRVGPFPVYWYGIGYALGLLAVYLLLTRLARRAGEDPDLVGNGMIIVAIAALIGGRLYHVIDQWQVYKDNIPRIFLPVAQLPDGSWQWTGFTGLGVYGGIATGLIAVIVYARYKRVSFWRWADIVAPGLFLMQAIARWGNFFNQELYGSPTTLPWGIPIQCANRIADFPCATFPFETTRFHPLFLYESLSGALGCIFLVWLGYHARERLRPGDLLLVFFAWYGVVRFALETLRHDNWTFFGIPTAQVVSLVFVAAALALFAWRHRPAAAAVDDPPPARPAEAIWGPIGRGRAVEALVAVQAAEAAGEPAGPSESGEPPTEGADEWAPLPTESYWKDRHPGETEPPPASG
ncbi:MAG: prolipoprotein diacylglyceryl transferase [Chloroflexota bacterium]